MAKNKIELPTEEQVGAFIETYIPEPLASSFAALLNGMINMQSVDVDTGNNDDAPVARGRGRGRAAAAEANENNDDAPPARGGRGRGAAAPARGAAAADDLLDDDDLLSNDDDANANANEDDAPPARRGGGRGRAAAEENNDDAPPARGRGRAAAAAEENDDDAPPARRGGRAARNNNDDDAPPARGPGRRAAPEPEPEENNDDATGNEDPIAFADLGGDEETVKEYTVAFEEYKNAKAIKDEVAEAWEITLKGSDKALLAEQAAEIYVAMELLTVMPMKKLDKMLADFAVEVDYGRTKSDKTKAVMAARALVEVALESFS